MRPLTMLYGIAGVCCLLAGPHLSMSDSPGEGLVVSFAGLALAIYCSPLSGPSTLSAEMILTPSAQREAEYYCARQLRASAALLCVDESKAISTVRRALCAKVRAAAATDPGEYAALLPRRDVGDLFNCGALSFSLST